MLLLFVHTHVVQTPLFFPDLCFISSLPLHPLSCFCHVHYPSSPTTHATPPHTPYCYCTQNPVPYPSTLPHLVSLYCVFVFVFVSV
jgi:hypothetical protein